MPTRRCCCTSCRLGADNFNRADENPVSGAWHEISGDWEVKDNELNSVSDGVLATTICHPGIYTNGSYVMRVRLIGMADGSKSSWEVSAGDPDSPNYVVEVTHSFASKQATLSLYSGNKTTLIHEETYSGVTNDREMTLCYSPGLTIDVSIESNPQIEFCSDVTGDTCYDSGGTDVGGFAFRKGKFDDWIYELHWLDLEKCEKCTCFCEKSREDFKCYPDVLYLSFDNTVGGATLPSIPLYQGFLNSASYLWPEKVAWYSAVQNCGGPVGAQWTARFLCGQEDLGSLAFGTADYVFESLSVSQIAFGWADNGNSFEKRDAIKAASTCEPILLTFPSIAANCASPSPSCTGGGVDCDAASCSTPYCTSLNTECYDDCPDIQFTPKVTE